MATLADPDIELHQRLISAFGREAVLVHRADRAAYAFDAQRESMLPSAVLLPRSSDDVAQAIRIAIEFEQPIVPRGGGTSLTGSAAPLGGGIVISLARMNRILALDPTRRAARVEPGVVTLDLSYAAARHGLFYAPDPESERVCTIGGNLATNAAGPHAFAYGTTSEQILALRYVDATGTQHHTDTEQLGFDLCGLFAGSEGTLGIVTELTVRLRRAPESIKVGVAIFPDIESAIEASTAIRERCGAVVALELLDTVALEALAASGDSPYPEHAKALLLIEFAGYAEETRESEERAGILVQRYAASHWLSAQSTTEAQRLWHGHRSVRQALARMSSDTAVHDLAVPRSRMLSLIRAVENIARRFGIRVAFIAHLGDGGVNAIALYNRRDARQCEAAILFGNQVLEMALSLGGGAGEYGIGTAKRALVYRLRGAPDRGALLRLHRVFDPDARLNPEKFLPFSATEAT